MKPLKDNVLVEPIKEEKLINIADNIKGKVIAVGDKVEFLKEGDIIRYQYGRKVDDYELVNENDVLILED